MAPGFLVFHACYCLFSEIYLHFRYLYTVHDVANIRIIKQILQKSIGIVVLEVLIVPKRPNFQGL